MRRVCLGVDGKACGQLIAKGSRCSTCAGVYEQARQVGRRALYTSAYRRRAVATIASQPWCSWCRKTTTSRPITSTLAIPLHRCAFCVVDVMRREPTGGERYDDRR